MSKLFTAKNFVFVFVFIYIGLITIPNGWVGSLLFILWYLCFWPIAVVIAVAGIWGIVGLLISKIRRTSVNPHYKFLIALSIFFIVWTGISYQIAIANTAAYENLPFDAKIWKENQSQNGGFFSSSSLRQRMIKDLTTNVLPNLTKSEVESLLGSHLDSSDDDYYIIGPEKSFFPIDYDCLYLTFDSNGKYEKYDTHSCG